jgi:hypothetical protein
MKKILPMIALIASAAVAGGSQAQQDSWPTKPVRVIVPFSLGGATDLVARILGPALAETLGQPICSCRSSRLKPADFTQFVFADRLLVRVSWQLS